MKLNLKKPLVIFDLETTGLDLVKDRIIQSTEKDLRYYLIQYVREHKKLHPQNFHLWRYVPDEWAVPAINRDRLLLFPDEK